MLRGQRHLELKCTRDAFMMQDEYSVAEITFNFMAFVGSRGAMPLQFEDLLSTTNRGGKNLERTMACAHRSRVLHAQSSHCFANERTT